MTVWKSIWQGSLFRLCDFFLVNEEQQAELPIEIQVNWNRYMEDIDPELIGKIWSESEFLAQDGSPFINMTTMVQITHVFVIDYDGEYLLMRPEEAEEAGYPIPTLSELMNDDDWDDDRSDDDNRRLIIHS